MPNTYPEEQRPSLIKMQKLLEDFLDLERVVNYCSLTWNVRYQQLTRVVPALPTQGCIHVLEESVASRM